jgi:LEA14-like dessication related protein
MKRIFLAWATAALLAGCAAIPTKAPEVDLADIGIGEVGLLEQRFVMKLRVLNPNDVDIQIDGLAFELEVNGQAFARGVSNKAVTLPRLGEAMLEVDAVSSLGSLLRQFDELGKGGREAIDYRIKGRLVTGSFGSLPFEHRGEVRLPRLPGERRRSPEGERT